MEGIDNRVRVKPLEGTHPARHRRTVVTPTKEADMAEDARDTAGMRAVFWIWAGIIGVGLAVMIGLPLGGR